MEAERDWKELPEHCLVEVLRRVGVESLVETVPLVCKSWHHATVFYPQCWQQLVFTKSPYLRTYKYSSLSHPRLVKHPRYLFNSVLHTHDDDHSLEKFVHFAVGRSNGLLTELVFLPHSRLEEGLITWIAERCPSLKLLVLPNHLSYVINFEVSNSICSWKYLEGLQVSSLIGLKKTIANINKNCQNFNHLSVYVPRLDADVASAIASQLPNIKTLDLRFSIIERDDLLVILKGCKNLEHLDVSGCKGVAGDDEILNLARQIRVFKHEGTCAIVN